MLAGLPLIAASSTDTPAKAGDVNEARVLADASQGADADAARVRALAAYKDFLTLWRLADCSP